MALVKLYEEKYMPNQKVQVTHPMKFSNSSFIGSSSTTKPRNNPKMTNAKATLPPLLPNPPGPPLKNSNIKRISPRKMQLHKDKGMCYFCYEKFSFNHKCPNKQVFVLQLEEDDSFSMDSNAKKQEEPKLAVNDDHHLSFNTLKGGLGVGTITLMAHATTMPIRVLIDRGNSNNFLQPRVAKILKLPIEKAISFKVMVGNDNYMDPKGLIQ